MLTFKQCAWLLVVAIKRQFDDKENVSVIDGPPLRQSVRSIDDRPPLALTMQGMAPQQAAVGLDQSRDDLLAVFDCSFVGDR